MKLLAGLGNPGSKYARNRHNIGFMALERIAGDHGFGPWRQKFRGRISEGRLGGEKVLLLEPQTFMNLSGESVGEALRFYRLSPADLIVFHDELDLAPGKVRVKTGGGHAGHNGLRSIHAHVGPDYTRVRMGIGHPGRKELVSGYVLHDFARADEEWLDDVLRGISDGVADLVAGDPARFMNAVARRTAPARAPGGSGKRDGTKAGGAKPGSAKKDGRAPARPSAASGADAGKTDAQGKGAAAAGPAGAEPDTRTPLQKLIDRFR